MVARWSTRVTRTTGGDRMTVSKYIGEMELKVSGKALLDDYKRLLFENNSLTDYISELSQAVGLITTLKPTMEMDADHPLDMAKEVEAYVTARIAELEESDKHWAGNVKVCMQLIERYESDIAELEMKIRHNALWQASEDAEERAHLEKLVPDLKKRIAELEAKSERFTVHSDIERQDDKWIPEVNA